MNLLKSTSTYGTNSQNKSAVEQKQLAKNEFHRNLWNKAIENCIIIAIVKISITCFQSIENLILNAVNPVYILTQ